LVDVIVGDETGSAKAFFKGENAHIIEKDNVIAIRNGLKRFIKNFISLEVDLFGRVTLEKNISIATVSAVNISEVEHKLEDKPRRNRRD
jgi:ssDNA-binding replication factor A large subunit